MEVSYKVAEKGCTTGLRVLNPLRKDVPQDCRYSTCWERMHHRTAGTQPAASALPGHTVAIFMLHIPDTALAMELMFNEELKYFKAKFHCSQILICMKNMLIRICIRICLTDAWGSDLEVPECLRHSQRLTFQSKSIFFLRIYYRWILTSPSRLLPYPQSPRLLDFW